MMNLIEGVIRELTSLEVNLVNSIFRLVLSMVLGMVVGAERKRKGQVAGIRTFALISMGACLAMILSIYVPQEYMGLKNGDPGRIAAQVITGIGFLGGGAMIHMKGAVRGLTTAAGIWMTAIIGMAVGIGMYLVSIGATLLILLTLVTFEQYEKRRKLGQVSKVIGLTIKGIHYNIEPYKEVLHQNGIHLSTFFVEYNYEKDETDLNLVILAHAYSNLMPLLLEVSKVSDTKKLTLSSQIDI
ncbi:MAG: MgtC/SapB family protein [Muribaculaceae bacterium]|nr:MgtC/SapB family protein [Muribaculaceae bacterium]MDE6792710.1 MgtC/SapB family protein [Muribaculaceae bacterium]